MWQNSDIFIYVSINCHNHINSVLIILEMKFLFIIDHKHPKKMKSNIG